MMSNDDSWIYNVMPYDPHKHHRRSIRLPGYNYASAGAYFLTITTQVRWPWFGRINEGQLQLNAAGQMVLEIWHSLPTRFSFIALDEAILMPDHFHALLWITADRNDQPTPTRPAGTAEGSLGRYVQAFKSLSTNSYIHGVRERGWPPFEQRLWQRNYYERIVRDDQELQRVRAYIVNNPARWSETHP
jgi:REP element-mobilizing transposase RayT